MRASRKFWLQELLAIQHAVFVKVSTNHYGILETQVSNHVWKRLPELRLSF